MIIISNKWPHRASMSRAVAMISFNSSSCNQVRLDCYLNLSRLIVLPYKARPLWFSSVAVSPSLVVRPTRCMASNLTDARASSSVDEGLERKFCRSLQQLELLLARFLNEGDWVIRHCLGLIHSVLTIIRFFVFAMFDKFTRQNVGFKLLSRDEMVILTGNFSFSSWSWRV